MKDPVLHDKRHEHTLFCRYATDLIERVSGKPKHTNTDASMDRIRRVCTGCIRKNCAVSSFGTISEPDGLSSQIIYQMKAEIDIQNWVNFYENPTDTN